MENIEPHLSTEVAGWISRLELALSPIPIYLRIEVGGTASKVLIRLLPHGEYRRSNSKTILYRNAAIGTCN
jgi:hypothetical protein